MNPQVPQLMYNYPMMYPQMRPVYQNPVQSGIKWADIEALFSALGANFASAAVIWSDVTVL